MLFSAVDVTKKNPKICVQGTKRMSEASRSLGQHTAPSSHGEPGVAVN